MLKDGQTVGVGQEALVVACQIGADRLPVHWMSWRAFSALGECHCAAHRLGDECGSPKVCPNTVLLRLIKNFNLFRVITSTFVPKLLTSPLDS